MTSHYVMKISTTIVDKLGVDLYDKVADVITELISNAYDADAEEVYVEIPLGKRLGWKEGNKIKSSDYQIIVRDDGHGILPSQVNPYYLFVGRNRRLDRNRAKSPKFKRPVTGRKGIGKFAPFGICKRIEILSAGKTKKKDKYRIAHFVMNYNEILSEESGQYKPEIGERDQEIVDWHGTKVILSDFVNRTVPSEDTFRRMLARRFGLSQTNFEIFIVDTSPEGDNTPKELEPLDIPIREDTKIDLKDFDPFEYEGAVYPVTGWVAYAQRSYRDEAMTGIRLYARKKMAAAIRDFNVRSGFTGEFNLRSYLVGIMHANWLDDDKGPDLIRTHRQDIQWGSDIGRAFELWGQDLMRKLARDSYDVVRKKKSDVFMEKSELEIKAKEVYADKVIQDTTIRIGKALGGMADEDALENEEYVANLRELALAVGPHVTLLDKLQQIQGLGDKATLELLLEIFRDVRVASEASLGNISRLRVQVIDVLDYYINRTSDSPSELTLQKLLELSPWLIQPEWSAISANQTFTKFRENLEGWWKRTENDELSTSAISGLESKRPDFVMIHFHEGILIIEIKKPGHEFNDKDAQRFNNYIKGMRRFFKANSEYAEELGKFKAIIVCDGYNLSDQWENTLQLFERDNILERKTWTRVLKDTQAFHADFITAWQAMQELERKKQESTVKASNQTMKKSKKKVRKPQKQQTKVADYDTGE